MLPLILLKVIQMPINIVPEWMTNLDDEDVSFIKKVFTCFGISKRTCKYLFCYISYRSFETWSVDTENTH